MMILEMDETLRRMPSLRLIEDPEIREETRQLTAEAPHYFWIEPATQSSSYHNPLCRETHGLWIHTLMLSTVIERLSDSLIEQEILSERELDLAHSAAILHDQRKHGDPEDPADSSISDHDLYMADVVGGSDLPDAVGSAIASHMGPWYDGPQPTTELERLVHDADMIASSRGITPQLPSPAPKELLDLGCEEVDR